VIVLMAVGPVQPAPLAAKALIGTLAKLLAARAPYAALRTGTWVSRTGARSAAAAVTSRGGTRHARGRRRRGAPACDLPCVARQDTLVGTVPQMLKPNATLRGVGHALPAELLPYAAANLLPVLLLPPERMRALGPARTSLQRRWCARRSPLRDSRGSRGARPGVAGVSAHWLGARAGRRRAARGVFGGLQGARAGVPGSGALCRGGAARAGRAMCAPARVLTGGF